MLQYKPPMIVSKGGSDLTTIHSVIAQTYNCTKQVIVMTKPCTMTVALGPQSSDCDFQLSHQLPINQINGEVGMKLGVT